MRSTLLPSGTPSCLKDDDNDTSLKFCLNLCQKAKQRGSDKGDDNGLLNGSQSSIGVRDLGHRLFVSSSGRCQCDPAR